MNRDLLETKYDVISSSKFNKQLKKIIKQGKEIEKLICVVKELANGKELELKYKDHLLKDTKTYKKCRECHIEPDWLLIYKYNEDQLILLLVETGSHSELFDM